MLNFDLQNFTLDHVLIICLTCIVFVTYPKSNSYLIESSKEGLQHVYVNRIAENGSIFLLPNGSKRPYVLRTSMIIGFRKLQVRSKIFESAFSYIILRLDIFSPARTVIVLPVI